MTAEKSSLYSDVVIIGAGFSGINMACQLQRQLGVTDYLIYERALEIGGAWQANKYPGCGVDIPGALYSLSWIPNTQFQRVYPSQPEILSYIKRIATTHKITKKIRLGVNWVGAGWDETDGLWHVLLRDKNGDDFTHKAKILISAVGAYSNPKTTKLPASGTFDGRIVHTTQWTQDFDLRGLDVVVVGNGCSAAQVVPAIAKSVKSLTQISRSPQHYIPMPVPNFEITPLVRAIFSWVPALLLFIRWAIFWILDSALAQFYEDEGGLRVRGQLLRKSRKYVESAAPERLRAQLYPDYDLGCRRRILDNGYLESLHRDNVFLTQDTITEIGSKEIMTASGSRHPADFIILATGFEFTQWQGDKVVGRNGITLQNHWDRKGGIKAYKTVAVNGFPNFFYVLGPNSGSGHTSVLFSMECGTDLIIKIAKPVLQRCARSVEVAAGAETEWCAAVQAALKRTVLSRSCSNQFSDRKTGWNFFSYPYSSFRLWLESRFPDLGCWIYE